jgi:hypothetical protein
MSKTSSEEKKKSVSKSKRPHLPLNCEDLPGLIDDEFPPLTQDKVRRTRNIFNRDRRLSPGTNTWTRSPRISDLEAFSSPARRSSTTSSLEPLSRTPSTFSYRPSTVAAIHNTSETNTSATPSYNAYTEVAIELEEHGGLSSTLGGYNPGGSDKELTNSPSESLCTPSKERLPSNSTAEDSEDSPNLFDDNDDDKTTIDDNDDDYDEDPELSTPTSSSPTITKMNKNKI